MKRLIYEMTEALRIAFAQIRAHKMRSMLTALGVIIGIMAVTLMGTAINGMHISFNQSLAMLGDDVLHVQKWPWTDVEDWWNYVNRPQLQPEDAVALNRIIAATPNTELLVAIPVVQRTDTVKSGDKQVNGVLVQGTNGDYVQVLSADFESGRFFTSGEATGGRPVCVLGYDVAHALFPDGAALDKIVTIHSHPFRVLGVIARQGSFLGLFSFDNQSVVPLDAYRKYISSAHRGTELQIKVKDKTHMVAASDELEGAMRRVRAQLPGDRDNFSINQQEAFKAQLDPVDKGITYAGFFITGLALFVGAIGIMNITFVSVKERTKEIGTRKALGARRRTILLQFLIEAAAVSLAGGLIGLGITSGLAVVVGLAAPQLPIEFSPGLMLIGLVVSAGTGLAAGFFPALGASRLDPVVALRYE